MTAAEETHATQLMRLAQTGDEAAYAEVLALLTTATRRFAGGRAGSVPWVDDVVQETLVSVQMPSSRAIARAERSPKAIEASRAPRR